MDKTSKKPLNIDEKLEVNLDHILKDARAYQEISELSNIQLSLFPLCTRPRQKVS